MIPSTPVMTAIVFLLAASAVCSVPVPVLKNVPSSGQASKFHSDPLLKSLQTMLKQGDLIRFYQTIKSAIHQHPLRTASETLAGDELERQLLIDRYATIAPLFERDENATLHEGYCLSRDIDLKEGIMDDLYVISKTVTEQNRPLAQKKEIARLCSLYAATVVRTLRDYYRPGIEEENRMIKKEREAARDKAFQEKWAEFAEEREQYNRDWKQPVSEEEKAKSREMKEKGEAYTKDVWKMIAEERELSLRLNVMEKRNSAIAWYFYRREGTLVKILLVNFPGRASEVFNYLGKAGYKQEEMMGLVDRTIGRSKETEFLYKSGPGKKFLKEKQMKGEQPVETE